MPTPADTIATEFEGERGNDNDPAFEPVDSPAAPLPKPTSKIQWSPDPVVRHQQVQQEIGRRRSSQQLDPRSVESLLAGSHLDPNGTQAQQEAQVHRQANEELAYQQRYDRTQAVTQRRDQITQTRDANSKAMADFTARGVKSYVDPASGLRVPMKDEQGRERFTPTNYAPSTNPATGLPSLARRTETGEMEHRLPPLKFNAADPKDEYLYADYSAHGIADSPRAMKIADAAQSNDIKLRALGVAGLARQRGAARQEVRLKSINDKRVVDLEAQAAHNESEQIGSELADPAKAARMDPATLAAKQARLAQLQESIKPGGDLHMKQKNAEFGYNVAKATLDRDAYADQEKVILHHLAAEGVADPESDPTFIANRMKLEQNDAALGDATQQQARYTALMAPKLQAQAEVARTNSKGPATSASVLKLQKQSANIAATLEGAGANVDAKVLDRLTEQKKIVDARAVEQFAKLAPDEQKRITELTRDPTLLDVIKGGAKSLAGATAAGGAEVLKGAQVLSSVLPAPEYDEFGVRDPRAAVENARQATLTPSQKLDEIKSGPAYRLGSFIQEAAADAYKKTSHEDAGLISKGINAAAEAAGGFAPLIASGPLAPATVGLQTAGNEVENIYKQMIAKGASPDRAADFAIKRSLASGAVQAAIFGFLPKPLKNAVDKGIADRIAKGAVTKFLTNRLAQGAEGAVLGAGTKAASNVAADRPIGEGVTESAAGLAIAQGVMPRAAPEAAKGTPPAPGATPKPGTPTAPTTDAAAKFEAAASAAENPPNIPVETPTAPLPTRSGTIDVKVGGRRVSADELNAIQPGTVPPTAPAGTDAASPQWMKDNNATLAAAVKPEVADKVEELSAQRKTAAQVARETGLDVDTVRAVRDARGVPSMTNGAGPAQSPNPDFEAWAQKRNAPTALPPEHTAILDRVQALAEKTATGTPEEQAAAHAELQSIQPPAPMEVEFADEAPAQPVVQNAPQTEAAPTDVAQPAPQAEPIGAGLVRDADGTVRPATPSPEPPVSPTDVTLDVAPNSEAPVNIGPRDATVSTSDGVATEKEKTMLAEQQRIINEAPSTRPVRQDFNTDEEYQAARTKYLRNRQAAQKPENPANAIPIQSANEIPLREAPENRETVGQGNAIDQGAAPARQTAARPGGESAPRDGGKPGDGAGGAQGEIAGAVSEAVKPEQPNTESGGGAPVSSMKTPEMVAELKDRFGLKEYNGKPIDDLHRGELGSAIRKARDGKLIDTLTAAKKKTTDPRSTVGGGLAGTALAAKNAYIQAHNAAIDLAILAVRAGRKVADVVKMAVDRFKAKFADATPEDVKQFEGEMRTYTAQQSPVQQSGPVPAAPDTTGIAHRVNEAAGMAAERGEGISAEKSTVEGREKYTPEKALASIRQFEADPQKRVSEEAFQLAKAHKEALAKETNAAVDAHGYDSPEAKAARDAEAKWVERVKPLQTEWHRQGQAQQGETVIDTGTFHGLARAVRDVTGRDLTPKEVTEAQDHASTVKGATDAADAAQDKVLKAVGLPRKTTPESIEAAKDVIKTVKPGSEWTPVQAKALWHLAKNGYLDKGKTDFNDIRAGLATDLGLSKDDIARGMASPKGVRTITDEMYAKMAERRRVIQQAKQWVADTKYPGYQRFFRGIPNAFFNLATFGHGTVWTITHAGNQYFLPKASGELFKDLGRSFKLMGVTDKGAYHERMMQDLVRDPNFITAKRAGLANDPFRYQDDYQNPGVVKLFKDIGLMGNRGFDGMKMFRQFRFNQEWGAMPESLKNEQSAKLIADSLNKATGISNSLQIPPWLSGPINTAFFAPKLEASRWAFLFGDPAKAAKTLILDRKTAKPEEIHAARQQMRQKATMAGVYLGSLLLNQAVLSATGSNQKINLTNPRAEDWLDFKAFGHNFGVVSPMKNTVRFLAHMALIARGDRTKLEQTQETRGGEAGRVATEYVRGKLSPFAGIATDAAFQSDVIGRPLPGSDDPLGYRAKNLGYTKGYSVGEYVSKKMLPIPLEEAATEIWRSQGVSEDHIDRWLRAIAIGASAGTTGVRITPQSPDYQPKGSRGKPTDRSTMPVQFGTPRR